MKLCKQINTGLGKAIHSNVPLIDRTVFDGKMFGYLIDSNNTYSSAVKSLKDASSIILRDGGKFGAVVYLGFGLGKDGKYNPNTEVQLTKKKESWRNLILSFYGLDADREEGRFKDLKSELMKHGLIIIK